MTLKDGKNSTGAQNVETHFDLYFHEGWGKSKPRVRLSQKMDNLSTMTKPMDVKVTNTSINIDGQAYTADAQGCLTAVLPETNKRNQFIEDNNHNWYYLKMETRHWCSQY